jgi:hypothetical protein
MSKLAEEIVGEVGPIFAASYERIEEVHAETVAVVDRHLEPVREALRTVDAAQARFWWTTDDTGVKQLPATPESAEDDGAPNHLTSAWSSVREALALLEER